MNERLKVLRPAVSPTGSYTVVGESSSIALVGGVNTSDTRIPVNAGDVIGLYLALGPNSAVPNCSSPNPLDVIAAGTEGSDVMLGGSVTSDDTYSSRLLPLSAKIEPDADHDGYGDETQDACPSNASVHVACPSSAPAPTLVVDYAAATTASKVRVFVTTNMTALVTVSGKVNLPSSSHGPRKWISLGPTKATTGPGVLGKPSIKFSHSLVLALRRLPSWKYLTLRMSLFADATITSATRHFTVQVPGTRKVRS